MATYTISTLQQLQDINDGHLEDDCVLANDIDASSTRTWNQGGTGYEDEYYGFLPIGEFNGTFDGQGHKITNLYINRTNTNGATSSTTVGLFGECNSVGFSGKFIKDLTLENLDITGATRIGALAGWIYATTIDDLVVQNVSATGSINGVYGYLGSANNRGVGGLCGKAVAIAFTDCGSSCTISTTVDRTRDEAFGGICGGAEDCTFTDCHSSGSINCSFDGTSGYYVGGFLGYNNSSNEFTNCTSSTPITINITSSSSNYVGGFCGLGTSGSTYTKCFSYGAINYNSTTSARVGGFIGYGGGTISKCASECDIENYSTHATGNHSGGFVGHLSLGPVTNCYAKGTVNLTSGIGHTDARIGGFCGEMIGSTSIVNCYSVGEVYSIGTPVNGGGFLGLDTGANTQTATFYDNETSGWTTDGGSATGKTTVQMKTESTFTDASWDFDDVWYISTFTRTPGLSTTVWLSESGDYENFEEGVKDADSFSLGVPTTNIILWTEALQSLLLGTAGDEWMIGSNKLQTPVSPTNFAVKQQTTYGSANIQALKINDVILFVDYVKRKIREMTYSPDREKYTSPDLTSLAEQITETGIVNMAHQKNPDSMLWCVLTDGSLISMVYDREQNVIAWSDHPIDGLVQSVCVTPGTDEDEVWISVKRTIEDADKVYIEKMASRTFDTISDCYFVDSGITDTGTSKTISGLDHLEGESVVALVDGVYDGTFTVVSGDITLNTTPVAKTIVGLPYTATLQPMRIVQADQGGTSLMSNTRIAEMKVNFLNTKGAQYGNNTSNLFDINFSDERLEDEAYITGLFSGDVPVVMPGGFSTQNPIYITSSQPLPLTVKSIVASFEETGR